MSEQETLLASWAGYLSSAATQGYFTKHPISIKAQGIAGPRAGVLLLYCAEHSPAILRRLNAQGMAFLRQTIPWEFSNTPSCCMEGRYVRVEAGWPEELQRTMIRLRDLSWHPGTRAKDGKDGGRWIVGLSETGSNVTVSLSDKTPHWLLGGHTGSGKSCAFRCAVTQLAQDADNRLVLIDGKFGESLSQVGHLPGVVGPVATDGLTTRGALAWVMAEMKRRYEGQRQGRLIVVFDEFQAYNRDAGIMGILADLAEQGRAAGVHMLLGTQHPALSAFGDESSRRNLVGRLALRVTDHYASQAIVGASDPRADRLLGAGDAYAVVPTGTYRVQGAYTDGADYTGRGEWAVDSWDGFSVEGQTMPRDFSARERVLAMIAARDEMGRNRLVRLLLEAGLSKPGSERADKLLKIGKEMYGILRDHGRDII